MKNTKLNTEIAEIIMQLGSGETKNLLDFTVEKEAGQIRINLGEKFPHSPDQVVRFLTRVDFGHPFMVDGATNNQPLAETVSSTYPTIQVLHAYEIDSSEKAIQLRVRLSTPKFRDDPRRSSISNVTFWLPKTALKSFPDGTDQGVIVRSWAFQMLLDKISEPFADDSFGFSTEHGNLKKDGSVFWDKQNRGNLLAGILDPIEREYEI